MNTDEKTPVLFECCRIIKGHTRSLVCDIQRLSYRFLPNEIADMLIETRGMTVGNIKLKYNNEFDDIIQENLDFLEKEEILFYTNNPEWFPSMSLEWDEPLEITNAIIDVDPKRLIDFDSIWSQLSTLGCEHVQIRIFGLINLRMLEDILNSIGTKRIISVEIILPYNTAIEEQDWVKFVYLQPRVVSVICHSAPENKVLRQSQTEFGDIYFMTEILTSEKHCGKIVPGIFSIDIKTFTESLAHNSCLNRKISIDAEGNIKNCPSMSESFGNVQDTSLLEAIEKPGFKKYWNITKDKIHVCKDCEFRYICTDCRAYINDPADILSKPLKCGYNPYTGEWSEWSTNPLKQKAIEYYGMQTLVQERQHALSESPQPKKE